jgi:hypothetical protein
MFSIWIELDTITPDKIPIAESEECVCVSVSFPCSNVCYIAFLFHFSGYRKSFEFSSMQQIKYIIINIMRSVEKKKHYQNQIKTIKQHFFCVCTSLFLNSYASLFIKLETFFFVGGFGKRYRM